MENKVWVTFETQHDYTGAERYGKIEFLTNDDLNNTKGSIRNEGVLADIAHKLKKYDPNNDWFVITGSPYITAAVFLMLGHMGIRSIQVLRWDNRDHIYKPMYIDLRQETIEKEST